MIYSTAFVLSIVVSLVIPLASSLLTRAHWSVQATGMITMLLSAISGFFVEWSQAVNIDHFNWKNAAVAALVSYAFAVAAHYGAWKGSAEALLHAFPGRSATPAPPAAPAA